MRRGGGARRALAEYSYLLLPLGFSLFFGFALFFSGELLRSPASVLFLLLTPVVGAAGYRWKRWRAWLTLVMTALSYEALAGVVDSIADASRVLSLFDFDKYIWGINLTGWVQSTLSSVSMTDFMAFLYQLLMPMVFATSIYIWYRNGHTFGRFVTAMLLTSYAALVTFLLLPTDPPWISGAASNLVGASGLASVPASLAPLAAFFEPNEFAAFPSLHAAYMVICTYFLLKVGRRVGGASVLLTAGILFSTLYLGQHYLVDLIAGAAYALVPCLVSERLQVFGSQEPAAGKAVLRELSGGSGVSRAKKPQLGTEGWTEQSRRWPAELSRD